MNVQDTFHTKQIWIKLESKSFNRWSGNIGPDVIYFNEGYAVFNYLHLKKKNSFRTNDGIIMLDDNGTSIKYYKTKDNLLKLIYNNSEFLYFSVIRDSLKFYPSKVEDIFFGEWLTNDSSCVTFSNEKHPDTNEYLMTYEILGMKQNGTWSLFRIDNVLLLNIFIEFPFSRKLFILDSVESKYISSYILDKNGNKKQLCFHK